MGASGEQHLSFLDITEPVARTYALRHSYDFRSVRGGSFSGRSKGRKPAWSKIPLIKEAILEGFDTVFWLDCDAVIVNLSKDIASEVTGKPINMVNQLLESDEACPNTGVLVVKNTAATLELLDKIWTTYIYGSMWEQSSFLRLIGYQIHSPYNLLEKNKYTDLVGWLDSKWNVHKKHRNEKGFIHHWSHMPYEERIAGLSSDANQKETTWEDYVED